MVDVRKNSNFSGKASIAVGALDSWYSNLFDCGLGLKG